MEVETDAQPAFVGLEEVSEPSEEEGNHGGIAVRESDAPRGLIAFAGVEGDAGDQQVAVAEFADSLAALGHQPFDLSRLRSLQLVRLAAATPSARLGIEGHVPRPE